MNCFFTATCHVKRRACFYEPQFYQVSLNISLSDSGSETKKLRAEVLNSTCQAELFKFLNFCKLNFDGLTFLTASVLYSQSDYLNHSNRDSDWLIVACFMRVKSMLTALLFALKIKFVLKIESNAWEFAEGI